MKLSGRIEKRFAQIGRRSRLQEAAAVELGKSIAWSHDRLGAFSMFCGGPNQRARTLNAAIIGRWLETIPVMLVVPERLGGRLPPAGPHGALSTATLEQVFSASQDVAALEFRLPEPASSHFASCLASCAGPAFHFYQRCMAPEDHSLRVLEQSLATYLGTLPYAAAAHLLRAEAAGSG